MIQSKNPSESQNRPNINLQALRDFSLFQFTNTDSQNPIAKQVRFISQSEAQIYNLDVWNFANKKNSHPSNGIDKDDLNSELAILVQIIEIYSERYPDRTIRLGGVGKRTSSCTRLPLRNISTRYGLYSKLISRKREFSLKGLEIQ